MIKPISCFGCGIKTKIYIRKVRTKHKESTLVLTNTPVYFCAKCNEVTIPFEVITAFKYVKAMSLEPGVHEFDFGAIYVQMKKEGVG